MQLETLERTRTVGNAVGNAVGAALGGMLGTVLSKAPMTAIESAPDGRWQPQAICLFYGEMGAGKTTLIKAICEGLGIDPVHVISPTYTLVNIYPGRVSVYHVDLFRLDEPDAMLQLDRDDWVNSSGLTLIEWPEVARPLLEGEALLELHLTAAPGKPERRDLRLLGPEEAFAAVFTALEPMAG